MQIKPKYIVLAVLWPFLTTTAVVAVFMLPAFLHCLDTSEERMDVAALSKGNYSGSSNLLLKAIVLDEKAVCLEETNIRYRTTSYTYFVPLAAAGDSGKQIRCIVKLSGEELEELSKQKGKPQEFRATLRNKLWEEMDEDVMERFQKQEGISENIAYAEFGPAPSYPLWVAGIVFSISLLGSYEILRSHKNKK
jgi:hypothetical protein